MRKSFLAEVLPALLCVAGALSAQTPAASLAFEVASIKPSPPLDRAKVMAGKLHIGMSVDAARVDIGYLSLADLIRTAYRVKSYQVSGPDWMSTQRFDILAKMPEGASKEQVPEMLQALLAERFKLAIHRESKEHAVYELVVGKSGPKLKESAPDPDPSAAGGGAGSTGSAARGTVVVGAGENQVRINPGGDGKSMTAAGGQFGQMKVSMVEGGMHMEFAKMTMPALAETLTRFADRPVVDMTELKGNYQVGLDLSMELLRNVAKTSGMATGIMMAGPNPGGGDAGRAPAEAASTPSGTSIFAAVQQLGLKLEPRKSPVETIVVDHLEKTPTEN